MGSKYLTQVGNIPALMEKLVSTARFGGSDIELQDKMVGAARVLGLTEEQIQKALYDTYDGPVFYYP